jgi:hypothetical protein
MMRAIQMLINGEVVCLAGAEGCGTLSADLLSFIPVGERHWETSVQILGSIHTEKIEQIRWKKQFINLGDEVTFRLVEVETNAVDEPYRRYRSDSKVQENYYSKEEIFQIEKAMYEELKKKFENGHGT